MNEKPSCLNCYWNDDLLCDRTGYLIDATTEDVCCCNLWEDKQNPKSE